ncbi:MAG: STM4014 family protein [Parahaliea sp.]
MPTSRHAAAAVAIVGGGSGHRSQSLTASCLAETGCAPRMISWHDFLKTPASLNRILEGAAWLRFDSPDQDVSELMALYQLGATQPGCPDGTMVLPGQEALLAGGAVGSPSQLCLGLVAAVGMACQMAEQHGIATSTTARDLALSFDKQSAQRCFHSAGIAVPEILEGVIDFDSLLAAMDKADSHRVFIKLRHGAAAAGMMALARHGKNWSAWTTAHMGLDGILRASRKMQRLVCIKEIARLLDRLAPLGLHVEVWIPKIGIAGETADVRLVQRGQTLCAAIVRSNRYPMTNLHLGGRRHPQAALVECVGQKHWQAICRTACDVARLFPDTESLGIDIAVTSDARRHYVMEANVFGDFIKDKGQDTSDLHRLAMRQYRQRLNGLSASARAASISI